MFPISNETRTRGNGLHTGQSQVSAVPGTHGHLTFAIATQRGAEKLFSDINLYVLGRKDLHDILSIVCNHAHTQGLRRGKCDEGELHLFRVLLYCLGRDAVHGSLRVRLLKILGRMNFGSQQNLEHDRTAYTHKDGTRFPDF